MEQHAVPRNISGFQFHLIGDMTVHQFAYLGGGILCAFIIYKLPINPMILRMTIAALCAAAGVAFAFVPIQERSLDIWLAAFIKSILSPTQYIWGKELILPEIFARSVAVQVRPTSQKQVEDHHDAKVKLQAYLKTLPSAPHQTINAREKSYVDATLALFNATNAVVVPPSPGNNPTPFIKTPNFQIAGNPPIIQPVPPPPPRPVNPPPAQPLPKVPSPQSLQQKPEKPLPSEIETLKSTVPIHQPAQNAKIQPEAQTVQTPPPPKTATISISPEYQAMQKQLADLAAQKDFLLKEIHSLKEGLKKGETPTPTIIKPQLAQETQPTIKKVTLKTAVREIGIPTFPQTPNIVIGVIKDAQRKLLPNIILTIKDVKGTPLRALKTNKLGQFVTATPLPNGTYFLEVEDPLNRFIFDVAEITLTGEILLPIEITAKGEKEIMREKLTKELFGANPI